MASSLSEEEFHRMQLQLLDLRTTNYELDGMCKKQEREIAGLKEKAETLEKEVQKCNKILSKSKKARELELLIQENNTLQGKLQSQEEDFRLQNQTLVQELSNLVTTNENFEKQVRSLEEGKTSDKDKKNVANTELEDEVRHLKAQNKVLQKNFTNCQEKYEKQLAVLREHIQSSSLSDQEEHDEILAISQMGDLGDGGDLGKAIDISDGYEAADSSVLSEENRSTEDYIKELNDLKLSLDTEEEEKKIIKEKLSSNEKSFKERISCMEEELQKISDKLKKKQESYNALQEEKEKLFEENNKKNEELQAARDRDQKYYTDQINKLKQELENSKKYQTDLKTSFNKTREELDSEINTMQQQINAASIVGSQHLQEQTSKYQQRINELQKQLTILTQQRDDLSVHLQEIQKAHQDTSEQLFASQQERDTQIQSLQEVSKVAEKRKILLDEMAIKYQKESDEHKQYVNRLEDGHQARVTALHSQLEEEKQKTVDLEKLKQTNTELQSNVLTLEERKGWLERSLSDTEELLDSIRKKNEATVAALKEEKDTGTLCLEENHKMEMEKIKELHQEQMNEYKNKVDCMENEISHNEEKIQKLKQELKDGAGDKKIHEKKGASMLRDLKRQLHAERKRAEKLQEKLQEVLCDSKNNKSMEELFRPLDLGCDSQFEERSSISSWSAGASGLGRESTASGPQSPTKSQAPFVEMEQEYNSLLNRVAVIQQEKWNLEEKVSHLEDGTSAMADDLLKKTAIIEHYVMESRTDHIPHHNAGHVDRLSLKKVIDMVNKGDDQGLKEMNKKLQRMLEETLTKNMHLQKDLEMLSNEVVRLGKPIGTNGELPVTTKVDNRNAEEARG